MDHRRGDLQDRQRQELEFGGLREPACRDPLLGRPRARQPWRGWRARSRDERGVSAVEMAFIAPGLIFLIFFCIQGALFFYGRNVALQAAREGVSQLRLAQDQATYSQIRGDVVDSTERFARTVGREALIDPDATPGYSGDRVSMTVTGHVITLVPGLHLGVTERAEGEVEKFEADR
ncbi:MAG: pilus assembly protein [Nocardioides sp.]|uniref:TadE/TadG family type IV pilus assembly protein n=1 Tax=Nocardioides sp. TaxID=35761 RepID=UPI0039E6BD5C